MQPDLLENLDAQACEARVGTLAFRIVVGRPETTGQAVHPIDPLSQAFVQRRSIPSLTLLRLMLGLVEPGQRVLDLGAHIGTFTLTAAAYGCHVTAVEPSPRNAALLAASLSLNGFAERVRLVRAAAGDRHGTVDFASYGPWGHIADAASPHLSDPTPVLRVDDLLREEPGERVAFVKMDIEGSEVAALDGMQDVLGPADALPILYESNYVALGLYGKTPRDLRDRLVGLGYRHHYRVRPWRLVSLGPDDFQAEVVAECLATKAPLAPPRGWRIGGPEGYGTLARQIVAGCREPDVRCRVYLGKALESASSRLLDHPLVHDLLTTLRDDPCPEVRAAVGWFERPCLGVLGRTSVLAHRAAHWLRRRAG
jgi:FkbM family methyltransferase